MTNDKATPPLHLQLVRCTPSDYDRFTSHQSEAYDWNRGSTRDHLGKPSEDGATLFIMAARAGSRDLSSTPSIVRRPPRPDPIFLYRHLLVGD